MLGNVGFKGYVNPNISFGKKRDVDSTCERLKKGLDPYQQNLVNALKNGLTKKYDTSLDTVVSDLGFSLVGYHSKLKQVEYLLKREGQDYLAKELRAGAGNARYS